MFDTFFRGLFDSDLVRVVSLTDFLLCVGTSLLAGLILAGAHTFRSQYTKSFVVTLATLPAVVCVVIMMVNGNIGTGVAVAGAFSLVRFRSAPGSAREITGLFLAMGAGLIAGMGYLGFSLLFTVILAAVSMLYSFVDLGDRKRAGRYKTLRITIPEDLEYTGVFDPILERHAVSWNLVKVQTTNMGSLFRLTYQLHMKDPSTEKEMIDELRCRNGNLEIAVSNQENATDVL